MPHSRVPGALRVAPLPLPSAEEMVKVPAPSWMVPGDPPSAASAPAIVAFADPADRPSLESEASASAET
jgi:hypothetical protein